MRFRDVAWQQPARLRNRIVHGYWSIDLGVLHTTASEQLPGFTGGLREVLRALQSALEAFRGAYCGLVRRLCGSAVAPWLDPKIGKGPE